MPHRLRHILIACSLSGLLHLVLLAGLTISLLPLPRRQPIIERESVASSSPDAYQPDEAVIEPSGDEQHTPDDILAERQVRSDALAQVDSHDPALADFARDRFEQLRAEAEAKPPEEQLAELETLGRRLSAVSNEQSVAQITDMLAPILGTGGPRANEPAANADDSHPFDPATAQIFDVRKEEQGETVNYTAVLVDAAGRTQELPLESADGETLYDLFALMKKFPLLETVYRNSVMGLLDRLMQDERVSPRGMRENDDARHSKQSEPKGNLTDKDRDQP